MRRVAALALMTALCLLLCACGGKGGADNFADDIQSEFSKAKGITMIVSVTADYGSRVYEYKLRLVGKNNAMDIEVIEPSGIKGIKAHVTDEGIGLEFDGVTLDTGELFGDGLSPLQAIPLMLKAWKSGYVKESWKEKVSGTQTIAVKFDISQPDSSKNILHIAWFDAQSRLPVKAEILSDGYRVISCTFGNVIME